MGKKKRIDFSKLRWNSLKRWLKKHRRSIIAKYHEDPFTKTGEINDRVLRRLQKDENYVKKLSGTHYKRILKKIRFKLNVLKG